MDLSLDTQQIGEHSVVSICGEIDVYTAPKLRAHLSELVGAGQHRIVVDLDQVDFMDSTGLGVLVGGLKKVRAQDGSLSIVCTQERLLKIFRITQLSKVFEIFTNQNDAVAAD